MTEQKDKAMVELRSALAKMEVALSYSTDAVVWTDASGKVQWCNAIFDRLVGRSHIEVVGRDLIALLPLEESGRVLPPNAHPVQLLLTRNTELRGYYHLTAGERKPFLEVIGRYFEVDPSGGSVILNIRDVSTLQEVEQIKLQSLALNAAANAIVITDRDGLVLWVNQAFTNLTGYALDDVYGQSLKILRSDQTDEEVFVDMWPTILSGRVWSGTLINRKKNGDLYIEEQTITPVMDADNRLSHFIAIKQDVTERERVNQELYLSESRMRALLETAADGIITTDNQGLVQLVNPAVEKLFGYKAEELIGRNVKILMPEPYHSRHDHFIRNYLETGLAHVIGFDREVVGRRSDGSIFPLELSLSEIKTGKTHLFTGILRDITQRKKAEKEIIEARLEAEKANLAKSVFLSNMSHEIRTPMNAVIGMADLLLETKLDPEQERLVRVLSSAGASLLAIINDILDLSKIEAGQITLKAKSFDLREELNQACQPFLFKANMKKLALECQVEPNLPRNVVGDPVRFRQILTNLLGNAIKFTEEGHIKLRVQPLPADFHHRLNIAPDQETAPLLLAVEDTGIGVPEDQRDHIFDRFSQADQSITTRYGGTGLGLAICKQLVEMMGGRIWLESGTNQGSIFYFIVVFNLGDRNAGGPEKGAAEDQLPPSLPFFQEAAADSTSPVGEPIVPMSILLVEDNADNRLIIQSFFKSLPISLDEATNGREALGKFQKNEYDLVLMDVRMPVMDGHQATEEIRKWEIEADRPPTPIIALTAHALEDDIKKSMNAGCNAHLTKPIRKEELVNAVRRYMPKTGRADQAPDHGVFPRKPLPDEGHRLEVDPLIKDLLPEFLEKKKAEVEEIKKALKSADYPLISHLGHNMKGTGTSFGFKIMTQIGARIEVAANQEDGPAIRQLVDELTQYMEHVHIDQD